MILEHSQYIETPADLRETLTKTNSLFAFDNIECERSTAFPVPATPNNNIAFAFANNEHNDGEGMRKRYNCQMQEGVVTKDGYLYIDTFSEGVYNAIFVCGDLLKLKALKEAGSIRELYEGEEFVAYPAPIVYAANVSNLPAFAYVDYLRTFGSVKPSWNLTHVLNNVLQTLGINCTFSAEANKLRVIPDKIEAVIKTENVTLTRTTTGATYTKNESKNIVAEWANNTPTIGNYFVTDLVLSIYSVGDAPPRHAYMCAQIRVYSAIFGNIDIIFPDDFPTNVFCCAVDGKITKYTNPDTGKVTQFFCDFLGGYRIKEGTNAAPPQLPFIVEGEPLSGRTITIQEGTKFAFFRQSEFVNYTGFDVPDYDIYPIVDTLSTDEYSLNVAVKHTTDNGNTAYEDITLKDNITDIDVIDALKAVATLEGKVLRYDADTETILFETLDFATWNAVSLDGKVVNIDNLKRTFANYAQNNIVKFDSADNVAERLTINYEVNNKNINEEKDLQTIPFSEGEAYEGGALYYDNNAEKESNKDSITKSGLNSVLSRVSLVTNNGISDLCLTSTSAKITAHLSLFEFEQIKENTLIYFNGVRYVWTSAQWSDNTAVFEVSKI